jgi:hypothetical protein
VSNAVFAATVLGRVVIRLANRNLYDKARGRVLLGRTEAPGWSAIEAIWVTAPGYDGPSSRPGRATRNTPRYEAPNLPSTPTVLKCPATWAEKQPRIAVMEVEFGQTVYVPNPDGQPVRGTVIARGQPEDAVEMNVDGRAVKRDVAIVRHEEGMSQGFIAHVPYEDLRANADE